MTPHVPPPRPDEETLAPHRASVAPDAVGARSIASEMLFAGTKEVHIVHRGSLYRLKQTALGKLILTK